MSAGSLFPRPEHAAERGRGHSAAQATALPHATAGQCRETSMLSASVRFEDAHGRINKAEDPRVPHDALLLPWCRSACPEAEAVAGAGAAALSRRTTSESLEAS